MKICLRKARHFDSSNWERSRRTLLSFECTQINQTHLRWSDAALLNKSVDKGWFPNYLLSTLFLNKVAILKKVQTREAFVLAT